MTAATRRLWHATAERGATYYDERGDAIRTYRVAKDGSWADIHITQPGGDFSSKRQPLKAGRFPFLVSDKSA
jgi:hypothetical protein